MALSNMFREPRREITESAVGIAVFMLLIAVPLAIARYIANAFVAIDPAMPYVVAMLIGIIITSIAGLVVTGLVLLTHAIGEDICNALARNGVELRPTRRWQ